MDAQTALDTLAALKLTTPQRNRIAELASVLGSTRLVRFIKSTPTVEQLEIAIAKRAANVAASSEAAAE